VKEATLDPFHGYKNAIDDQLADARAVLDALYAEVLVMPMWSALVLVGRWRGWWGRHNHRLRRKARRVSSWGW